MISLRNSSKALDSRKTAICTCLYLFLSCPVPSRIGSQLKTGQIYTNQPKRAVNLTAVPVKRVVRSPTYITLCFPHDAT